MLRSRPDAAFDNQIGAPISSVIIRASSGRRALKPSMIL